MIENYYYVSEDVIVAFPELEKSEPFKSGYKFDEYCNYYIAKIEDFDSIEEYYNSGKALDNFFAYEIVDSNVSLEYEDFDENKNEVLTPDIISEYNGILSAIEETLGLTKERNVAYVFYKLSEQYKLNPIEFVNKYL